MKPSILKSCTLVLCLAILPSIASAKPTKLTYTSQAALTHPGHLTLTQPWGDLMEERSGGNLEILWFSPGTLIPSPEIMKSVHKGVVGFTLTPLATYTSMFPAATVMDLPFLYQSSRTASLASALLFEQNEQVQENFKDWKVLAYGGSASNQLVSVRKPIKTLEDLKGLKVATNSYSAVLSLTALGAIPVVVSTNDIYLTLQRGMADALLLPIPAIASTKVTEFAKYITICNFGSSSLGMVMSKKTFNTLPKNVQEEIDKLSTMAMTARLGAITDANDAEYKVWLKENHNVEFYILPENERERWREAVQPAYEDWFERSAKLGVENPEELLKQAQTILDSYEDPIQEIKNILLENKEALGSIYPTEEVLNLPY